MKLYMITRVDATDYDEYDKLIVRAESEAEALELLKLPCAFTGWNRHACDDYCLALYPGFKADGSNAVVKELIAEGIPRVIMSSFRPG